MQKVVSAIFALVIAFVLFVLAGCSRVGGVELDPRDEENLERYIEETGCDNRSTMVELKIVNRGMMSEVYMYTRSGTKRRLGLFDNGVSIKKLSRHDLEVGGFFIVRAAHGLKFNDDMPIYMDLLSCDVGTLEIGSTPNLSFYMGGDLYPKLQPKH